MLQQACEREARAIIWLLLADHTANRITYCLSAHKHADSVHAIMCALASVHVPIQHFEHKQSVSDVICNTSTCKNMQKAHRILQGSYYLMRKKMQGFNRAQRPYECV
jgi:hypothetical protein